MSQGELTARINEAISLLNTGRREEAHARFMELSRQYPNDQIVWLWLSAASNDLQERIEALKQVLRINPANEKARTALVSLTGAADLLPPLPQQAAPVAQSRQVGLASPVTLPQLELAAVVILGIAAVFVLVLLGGSLLRPILNPPTPTLTITPSRTPTPITPSPTYTASVTPGGPTLTPQGPTLPPTWPPSLTWTPRPSRTRRPTATIAPTYTRLPSRTPRPTWTPVPPTATETPVPPLITAAPIRPTDVPAPGAF